MSGSRRLLTVALALLGVGALVVGAWSASQYRSATFRRPFFAEPSGLAAGPDGSLYVGVGGVEIHRYRPDGAPAGGWRLPRDGGALRLRFAESGALRVATRAGHRLEYDPQGVLVADRADPGAWARFPKRESVAVPAPGGARAVYALTEAGLVRAQPAPREVLVPLPPWPLAVLGPRPLVPITALLTLAPAALVVGLALARRAR